MVTLRVVGDQSQLKSYFNTQKNPGMTRVRNYRILVIANYNS